FLPHEFLVKNVAVGVLGQRVPLLGDGADLAVVGHLALLADLDEPRPACPAVCGSAITDAAPQTSSFSLFSDRLEADVPPVGRLRARCASTRTRGSSPG